MEYPLPNGAAYEIGAAVVLVSGQCAECGADPALIQGFSAHPAGVMPNPSRILVEVARPGATFFITGSRAPLDTDVGAQYGISKDADGIWYLDAAKSGAAARLYVEDVDLARAFFEVSVLDANRQTK